MAGLVGFGGRTLMESSLSLSQAWGPLLRDRPLPIRAATAATDAQRPERAARWDWTGPVILGKICGEELCMILPGIIIWAKSMVTDLN